jgi:hypothetical protein
MRTFGAAPFGEVDPSHSPDAIVQHIPLARGNARAMVESGSYRRARHAPRSP